MIELLNKHWPSMRDEDESTMMDRLSHIWDNPDFDLADMARRTCACGLILEGFDEYVVHLKEVLS
jgi:hypothetical protein